jgi:hypothetical protein
LAEALIFQIIVITVLGRTSKSVQIPKNLGIVTVEPDKDMQQLYNLYLKNLGIKGRQNYGNIY